MNTFYTAPYPQGEPQVWEVKPDDYLTEEEYLASIPTPPKPTLEEVKTLKRQAFASTFATIEQRAMRPQSAVLAALIDAGPVPEPDADYIWQLEDIKATNRDLLHQLEACTNVECAEQIEPWLPDVQGAGQGAG